MSAEITYCYYCGEQVVLESPTVWVDSTGGDCCSGDDQCHNENQPHTPTRNTGTLGAHVGAPALERVCTGTWVGSVIVHQGPPCPLHDVDDAIVVLTSAPAAYDYDHTYDTGRTEQRYRAECRMVIIPAHRTRQQMDRYLSGAYVAEVW